MKFLKIHITQDVTVTMLYRVRNLIFVLLHEKFQMLQKSSPLVALSFYVFFVVPYPTVDFTYSYEKFMFLYSSFHILCFLIINFTFLYTKFTFLSHSFHVFLCFVTVDITFLYRKMYEKNNTVGNQTYVCRPTPLPTPLLLGHDNTGENLGIHTGQLKWRKKFILSFSRFHVFVQRNMKQFNTRIFI